MSRLTRLAALALGLFAALAPLSASATPSNTRIVRVEECIGTSSSCSSAVQRDDGAVVDHYVQIEASAGSSNSTGGFSWLQVHIRRDGDSEWTCVRQWSLGGATSPAPRSFVLDTTRWPSNASCDLANQTSVVQSASARTANGLYEIRARARDTGIGGALGSPSEIFTVRISNRPSTPTWAAEPRDIGPSKKPAIELRWTGSPEPDMVQYDIERTGPDGTVVYNVSASSPGSQGCARAASTNVYTCYDTNFPTSGYGGSYAYRVIGFRSTPADGVQCRFGGSCVSSQASSPESATVNEPSPSPSPSNGGGSPSTSPSSSPSDGDSPSSRPRNRGTIRDGGSRVLSGRTDPGEFFTGTYDEQLPYEQRGDFGLLPGDDTTTGGGGFEGFGDIDDGSNELASPGGSSTDEAYRRLLVAIATGLLMILIAMHVARLLMDR